MCVDIAASWCDILIYIIQGFFIGGTSAETII